MVLHVVILSFERFGLVLVFCFACGVWKCERVLGGGEHVLNAVHWFYRGFAHDLTVTG